MVTQLRMIRTARGLTIRELAKMTGIHEICLNVTDLGQKYAPLKWRKPLADALNVPVDSIFDENGWPILYVKDSDPLTV